MKNNEFGYNGFCTCSSGKSEELTIEKLKDIVKDLEDAKPKEALIVMSNGFTFTVPECLVNQFIPKFSFKDKKVKSNG